MTDRDPILKACTLYERVSDRGRTYFAGRMAGLSVRIFRDGDATSPDGHPLWNLCFTQAPGDTLKFGTARQPAPARSTGQGSSFAPRTDRRPAPRDFSDHPMPMDLADDLPPHSDGRVSEHYARAREETPAREPVNSRPRANPRRRSGGASNRAPRGNGFDPETYGA